MEGATPPPTSTPPTSTTPSAVQLEAALSVGGSQDCPYQPKLEAYVVPTPEDLQRELLASMQEEEEDEGILKKAEDIRKKREARIYPPPSKTKNEVYEMGKVPNQCPPCGELPRVAMTLARESPRHAAVIVVVVLIGIAAICYGASILLSNRNNSSSAPP